jgi:type II secretory ATPase GspE/PulE/Tfp pilus assembly ATPase PilB-like protein
VRAVDAIIASALDAKASDVHVEPAPSGGRIRERVDGILREARSLPEELFAQVVSRIKLLAGMDIADRRAPQDGGYSIDRNGRCVDLRVSSMPTIVGEKLVVRLLDVAAVVPTLERLGCPPSLAQRYRSFVHAPSGFVVVCGPTGSGKTTTLYASIAERNVEAQHICTVEDPVEARLPGVAQVQVNPRAGVTFASVLRASLRQDPNVVMVGEMRDRETAGIAAAAALSGQLIVTTLHSSSALQAVDRLIELGISQRTLSAALSAVVSQRLLRVLCPNCKRLSKRNPSTLEAAGCDECFGLGYRGRTGVFELLAVDGALRSAIGEGSPIQIAAAARSSEYIPLRDAALELVASGETSFEEFTRVLGDGGPR